MKNILSVRCIGVCIACILLINTVQAQSSKQKVTSKKISPDLFGIFFEDINYAADGGLYAELIQNRSFEYNPADRRDWNPLSFWQYITPGYAYGAISIETTQPVHSNNPHYLLLSAEHTGDSGVGIKNSGFNGIFLKPGESYNLSFSARLTGNKPAKIVAGLQNKDGSWLASATIDIASKQWSKYNAAFTTNETCDSASLVLLLTTNSSVALDVISLFPQHTFKGHPNGLRADLATTIANLHPKFVRFPGGCLAHGDGLGNMYRWKNTIGPIEERTEQKNIWGYHQTEGLGYYEYFQFCEDIGSKPLPILPAGVSCQNSGGTWRIGGTGQKAIPMDEMNAYVQEVLDLIEWANGPATSTWGSKRAAAGHPEPFHLEYIGVGNEDKITPEFKTRFKMIYDAVKTKHPEITVIGTVGPSPDGEDFNKGWQIAKDLSVPVVDEHYYQAPEWFMKHLQRYDSYERKNTEVYLGEYASWGNKLENALAEAAYMTTLERNGDVVRMASYAPLLSKKGFTQWKPDLIYFDNSNICLSANYWVQQLFSANQGDYYYSNVVSFDKKDTTLAASCVKDSQTGDIILKIVNAGNQVKPVSINLGVFGKLNVEAEQIILTGNAGAENTYEHPQQVVPVQSSIKTGKKFLYNAPGLSLTVLRLHSSK
jgi:alpha-L-arabinofuranosidase